MHAIYKPLKMELRRKGLFCLSSFLFIKNKLISPNLPPVIFSTHKTLHTKSEFITGEIYRTKLKDLFQSEIISPFLNTNFVKNLKPVFKRKMDNKTAYSFVVDISVASDIVDKILESRKPGSVIVEGNPGFGLITHFLLKSDVKKINIFDDSKIRALCLDQLLKEYSDRLQLIPINLLKNEYFNNSCLALIREKIPVGKPVAVVGVIQPNFLHYLVNSVKLELIAGSQGENFGVEFYVLIREDKATELMFKRKWFYIYCLFNLVFKAELLGEYPGEAFLPSLNKNKRMNLLKLTIKPNPFENINRNDLNNFQLFLQVLGRSQDNYIIKTLEKWIPDCGPYLISKGISMVSQTRDLSLNEIVVLFNLIRNCEGYWNLRKIYGEVEN